LLSNQHMKIHSDNKTEKRRLAQSLEFLKTKLSFATQENDSKEGIEEKKFYGVRKFS